MKTFSKLFVLGAFALTASQEAWSVKESSDSEGVSTVAKSKPSLKRATSLGAHSGASKALSRSALQRQGRALGSKLEQGEMDHTQAFEAYKEAERRHKAGELSREHEMAAAENFLRAHGKVKELRIRHKLANGYKPEFSIIHDLAQLMLEGEGSMEFWSDIRADHSTMFFAAIGFCEVVYQPEEFWRSKHRQLIKTLKDYHGKSVDNDGDVFYDAPDR